MADERTTRRRFLQAFSGVAVGSAVVAGVPELNRAESHGDESWTRFGYNDGNTGHAPGNTAPVSNIQEQWSFETGDLVFSSPTAVDGTVYVGSDDNNVYAIDAGDGTERWSFETGGPVSSSPAVVDDTVYVGSSGNNVYALDAGDGTEQWSFETGDTVFSSPAVVDGTVYVGSWDNNVYALDAGDGTEQWSFETGDRVYSSPAVVDGIVYVGSWDNNVYAIDAGDGTEQWSYQTGDQIYGSLTVTNGSVYVGSTDNNVYALDAGDGTEQWSFETADLVTPSPAVANDTVYVGNGDFSETSPGTVYALDAGDGTEKWSVQTGEDGSMQSSPAVVDGTLYVGRDDDVVYALDAADGTEQWSYQTDSAVRSSPAVVDGTVYVGSFDNNVYALNGGSDTGEPTFSVTSIEMSPSDGRVQRPTTVDITATIENVGGIIATQTVELRVDGTTIDATELTLESGEIMEASLSVNTETLDPGEYTYTVATADDEGTGTLVVESVLPEDPADLFSFTAEDTSEFSVGSNTIEGVVTNPYLFPVENVELELDVPEDWTVEDEARKVFDTIESAGTEPVSWSLSVPETVDQQEGSLTATVSYSVMGERTSEIPTTMTVSVESADTPTPTPTDTPTPTEPDTSTPTDPPNGTVTDGPGGNQTGTGERETNTETPSQETPGFGIGTALMGLGSSAYMLKRRLDPEDDER